MEFDFHGWLHDHHHHHLHQSPRSYLLIIIALAVATISFFFIFYNLLAGSRRNAKLPPSPPRLPIIGNLHQLTSNPPRALHALSQKLGPLMLLYFGGNPTYVVSSAELTQEVIKANDLVFSSRPLMRMAKKLLYGCLDVAFVPYGEYWRQARRIVVLHLLSAKRVHSFMPIRDDETPVTLEKLRRLAAAGGGGGAVVDFREAVTTHVNSILGKATFGKSFSVSEEGGRRVCNLISGVVSLLGALCVGDLVPWLRWVDRLTGLDGKAEMISTEMDTFLDGVIKEARGRRHADIDQQQAASPPSCLADVLLSLDANDAGVTLGDKNIKALLLEMFAGGADSIAGAIEWTMAELASHPEMLKRAAEEVRRIAGWRRTSRVEEEDLVRMTYLKALMKESLRYHPPSQLLVRVSVEETTLQGYKIPAGTRLMINVMAVGRDPKSWQNPEEFMPERFLDGGDSAAVDFKGLDCQLIPFGGGRRGCPGAHLTVLLLENLIANLLLNFDWELPAGDLPASERKVTSGASVRMKNGFKLVARLRADAADDE